jgi:hypothetical protein
MPSFHQEYGHLIEPANSYRGKWKIKATPTTARFFETLTAAKAWAKKNPVDAQPLLNLCQTLAGTTSSITNTPPTTGAV